MGHTNVIQQVVFIYSLCCSKSIGGFFPKLKLQQCCFIVASKIYMKVQVEFPILSVLNVKVRL